MKAAIFYEHGGSDVVRVTDIKKPSLDPRNKRNEVIVRVKAAALNHLDLLARNGIHGVKLKLPHVSGTDVSGIVDEVSSKENESLIGRRVVLYPGTFCGKCYSCLAGRENLCSQFKLIGFSIDGGFAEYIRIPIENLFPIPKGLSFIEAAAVPLTFLTAWHALRTIGHLSKGEILFVPSAGSGLGVACIEVAKYLGAQVIASVGDNWKLKKLKEDMGIRSAINYRDSVDLPGDILNLSKNKGVDVIIDHVGGENWKYYPSLLKAKSRVVSVGSTSGPTIETDLGVFYLKEASLLGSYVGTVKEFRQVLGLFGRKKLKKPIIDSVHDLSDISKSMERLEGRKVFGKIVLEI